MLYNGVPREKYLYNGRPYILKTGIDERMHASEGQYVSHGSPYTLCRRTLRMSEVPKADSANELPRSGSFVHTRRSAKLFVDAERIRWEWTEKKIPSEEKMKVSGGVVSRVLSGWNVNDTWIRSRLGDGTTGGPVDLTVGAVYIKANNDN